MSWKPCGSLTPSRPSTQHLCPGPDHSTLDRRNEWSCQSSLGYFPDASSCQQPVGPGSGALSNLPPPPNPTDPRKLRSLDDSASPRVQLTSKESPHSLLMQRKAQEYLLPPPPRVPPLPSARAAGRQVGQFWSRGQAAAAVLSPALN